MSLSEKYLPTLEARYNTVLTQIAEAQTIIFRLTLDKAEGEDTGNTEKVEEADVNIGRLKKKIDLLEGIASELEKQLDK